MKKFAVDATARVVRGALLLSVLASCSSHAADEQAPAPGPAEEAGAKAVATDAGARGTHDAGATVDGGSVSAPVTPEAGSADAAPSCSDACKAGATQCSGTGTVQTCKTGASGCLAWSDTSTCTNGDTCAFGFCGAHGTWSTGPAMASPRTLLGATTGLDGRIYAVGGYMTSVQVTTTAVEIYSPATKTWTKAAPLSTPREGLAVVTAPDGRILAIGGGGSASQWPVPSATAEAYDPATNKWSAIASMSTMRAMHAAVTGADGRIYVMGGYKPGLVALATVEAYSPSSNTWTTLVSMSKARSALTAIAAADGRIYAIGGAESPKSAEVYTPSTNTWAGAADAPSAVITAGGALGADGQLYVFGGSLDATYTYSSTTALAYSPSANAWSTLKSMPQARMSPGAAGSGGQLFVMGGRVGNFEQSSMSVWTP